MPAAATRIPAMRVATEKPAASKSGSPASKEPAAGSSGPPFSSKSRRHSAAASAVVLAAVLGLSQWPWFLERIYAPWLGPTMVRTLAGVTGLVPLSVAEPLTAAALAYILIPPVAQVARVRRGEARLRDVVASEMLRVSAFALGVAAMFYLAWGAYYARPAMVTRFAWEPFAAPIQGAAADAAELARLAAELVNATNSAYQEAHATEDLEDPSEPPARQSIERALEAGYRSAAFFLPVDDLFGLPRGPAKPLLLSPAFSRLGLAGIYFPWTGEANFNRLMPGYQIPHSISHEKAHQRGITGEDEANFVGFVAAAAAPEPYVRYSALLFAQRQLIRELALRDNAQAAELLKRRLPGVQRDVDAAIAFWRQYEGPAREAQQQFNDRYLRMHGIEGGIQTYGESARLLVIYSRYAGGSVIPTIPQN